MNSGDPPRFALIEAPQWLWGGDVKAYFESAQLRVSAPNAPEMASRVQTSEGYWRRGPDLVSARHIAGPATQRPDFAVLKRPIQFPEEVPSAEVLQELERRHHQLDASPTLTDLLNLSRLATATVAPNQVPETVRDSFMALLNIGTEDDPDDKVFAQAGVHVIERSPHILNRCSLVSIFMRLAYDKRLRAGDMTHLRNSALRGDLAFASSQGLRDGVYSFDAYIGPLIGALTPTIWALAAPRSFGTVVYSLGQPVAGTRGDAAELLHLLMTQGATEPVDVPNLSSQASSRAVDWWAGALNRLFGVLTDPAVFTDVDGRYVPVKHLQSLLTIEQLFRRVASIQAAHRDTNARRVLLFTVMDTLERLTGRPIDKHCLLTFAQATLQRLRASVDDVGAEVLLPNAERAVKALEAAQDGFFIRRHLGTEAVELGTAPESSLSVERAVASYIKVLRNATHGHGSDKPAHAAQTNALLAHHDGGVPHDLGLLGYLYLLDLLDNPENLRKRLYAGGKS